jgi:hypothetical protein
MDDAYHGIMIVFGGEESVVNNRSLVRELVGLRSEFKLLAMDSNLFLVVQKSKLLDDTILQERELGRQNPAMHVTL